jgi:hypothetical protein
MRPDNKIQAKAGWKEILYDVSCLNHKYTPGRKNSDGPESQLK